MQTERYTRIALFFIITSIGLGALGAHSLKEILNLFIWLLILDCHRFEVCQINKPILFSLREVSAICIQTICIQTIIICKVLFEKIVIFYSGANSSSKPSSSSLN